MLFTTYFLSSADVKLVTELNSLSTNKMVTLKLFKTVTKIIYVKPKKFTSKVPQSINVYFIMFLCIFGFDFGFKKTLSKYLQLMFSCLQLCVAITMCIVLLYHSSSLKFDNYMALVFTFQYLTHCILLLFSKYNVYDLILDVYTLDSNIMKAVNNKLAFVLYFYTIMTCGLKQSICVVNCSFNTTLHCGNSFPGYWYCAPLIALDSITIIQMLLCYYVYRSVKYIKMSLNNSDIKTVQERYYSIITYCDKIRPLNSALVSVVILFSKSMTNVICCLNVSKTMLN